MPVLVNSISIGLLSDEVFDFCSDLQNEPKWNPDATSIERVTPGPLGVGTQFRAKWRGSPPVLVEYLKFERPRIWETLGTAKGVDVGLRVELAPQGESTRLTVTHDVRPKGLMRLLSPVFGRVFQKTAEKQLANMKALLERSHD
jgi:hypothetical protein